MCGPWNDIRPIHSLYRIDVMNSPILMCFVVLAITTRLSGVSTSSRHFDETERNTKCKLQQLWSEIRMLRGRPLLLLVWLLEQPAAPLIVGMLNYIRGAKKKRDACGRNVLGISIRQNPTVCWKISSPLSRRESDDMRVIGIRKKVAFRNK